MKRLVFALCLLACGIGSAHAVDPSKLYGNWTENGDNGTMAWTFTATSVSFVPVSPKGKELAPPNQAQVVYTAHEDSITIDLKTPNGKEGGMIARFENDKIVDIEFPDVGTHTLVRAP